MAAGRDEEQIQVTSPPLVVCPYCSVAIVGGKFCGSCGRPLGAPPIALDQQAAQSGAVPAQWSPQPAPPGLIQRSHGQPSHGQPSRDQPSRRWPANPRKSLVSGAVVLLALGTGSYLVLGGTERHFVRGYLSLTTSSMTGQSVGSACSGSGDDQDIYGGAAVVITDLAGKVLVKSALNQGVYDGRSCLFGFRLPGVPKAAFYRVNAGNSSRGGPEYSFSDLQSAGWLVHLTLSD